MKDTMQDELNPYVPFFIDLSDKNLLIVGGGKVAERKAKNLVDHGYTPTVIAPTFTTQLQAWGVAGTVHLVHRAFKEDDVIGRFIVFCATNDSTLNDNIAKAAHASGALVNAAHKRSGEVIMPCVLSRKRLQIAISTSGASPALAKHIRSKLSACLDESWEDTLDELFEQSDKED